MISVARSLGAELRGQFAGRAALLVAGGWVVGAYVLLQVLRLVSNVALAWLLAPELLGTMLLINTLRTGGELLTDVGIGQSIVNHRQGDEPRFYNTAWTVQIVRGLFLFAVALVATIPIARLYDEPQLLILLPISALTFAISGFMSPSRFLLQRHIKVKILAIYNLASAAASVVITVGLALIIPNIWALILGLLISNVVSVVASFFLIDWRAHRIVWDRKAVRAILKFGKWVFISSLVYYAAGNFDRLYLADAVPLALLGVYGIARTLSDTVLQLVQHVATQIVFPKVSASELRGPELRAIISPMRRIVVWALALAMGFGITIADSFILLVYDARYAAAAVYLPILLLGAWFGTLASIAESVLMGIGKPADMALGNAAKLAAIFALVPAALTQYGLTAAVAVFAAVEVVRYAVLLWRQKHHGLSFLRQDAAATALMILVALLLREAGALFHLNSGITGWITATQASLG